MAGLRHCKIFSTAFGAKDCSIIARRFSLYEMFLEMEKEALVSKFYIIEPSQNWDKWLNKPVSQFHFEADIDQDIFI